MHMRRSCKAFDLSLELLITLPKFPKGALMKELVLDLGLRNQDDFEPLTKRLVERGLIVIRFNDNERKMAIAEHAWDLARHIGEEYWRTVYGE